MPAPAPPEPTTRPDSVVVGVDGSAASIAALDWAVAESVRDARALHVVLARERPARAPYAPPLPEQRGDAESVGELVETVRGHLRGARADLVVREGRLEQVLLRESAGAAFLVVGRAAEEAEIGSLARTCVARAPCAVVVVSHDG
ncbi:MAG TPA: universal stress protein [Jiangellales bacterium]|nr:universal stress protein [Jiangellales bacterium]